MTLRVVEKHDLPLVNVNVAVPSGSADDEPGHEGRARHAAELMRRGAGGRSRAELDAALDQIGASLDVNVGTDAIYFSLACLSKCLEPALALLGDVLARPHLDEDEHERLRRESLAALDDIRDDDAHLATRYFERYALLGHPYGRTAHGTAASLTALTRKDAVAWVERHVAPGRHAGKPGDVPLAIGFAGDVTAARAAELSAQTFGAPAPLAPADLADPEVAPGRRTYLIDKPERTQSQILLGHAAPRYASADFLPLHVGATVFGGTFTARLMTEVRVKRGWSYGASSRVVRAHAGHTFRIRVFPAADQTPDTLALVLDMWQALVDEGVSEDEVAFAKSYLEGSWAFEIDTARKRLDRLLDTLVLGLPEDFYERWPERLRAVTADEVNAALRRWLRPADAVIVCTCTAETLRPRLEKLPLGEIAVVPHEEY